MHQKLYDAQIAHTRDHAALLPAVIAAPDTIDAWRHERMYRVLAPLVAGAPEWSWLTLGDSGGDAFWLRKNGAQDVTASSISLDQLATIRDAGRLEGVAVRALNAEALDLPDASVDFVCCKEMYHHLPRPPVGFYEMLRISRIGVALVAEPNGEAQSRPLDRVRRGIKRVLRRNTFMRDPDFEESGNFIFGPTVNEIRKMLTGVQFDCFYYRHLSDFYHPKLAVRRLSDLPPSTLVRSAVLFQDMLSAVGLTSWAKLSVVIFKRPPAEEVHRGLLKQGMKRIAIRRNPYLRPE